MEHLTRRALFSVGMAGAALPLVSRVGMADPVNQPDPNIQPPPIKIPEPIEPPIPAVYPWPLVPDISNRGPWPIFNIKQEGYLPKVYFIRHKRVKEYENSSAFPAMSIFIEGRQLMYADLDNRKSLTDYYEDLEMVKIPDEPVPYHFIRASHRIAKSSRRGNGNTVLYQTTIPKGLGGACMDVYRNGWSYYPSNILAYCGISGYDRPFVGFRGMPGVPKYEIFWVAHPDYQKYALRYKLIPA